MDKIYFFYFSIAVVMFLVGISFSQTSITSDIIKMGFGEDQCKFECFLESATDQSFPISCRSYDSCLNSQCTRRHAFFSDLGVYQLNLSSLVRPIPDAIIFGITNDKDGCFQGGVSSPILLGTNANFHFFRKPESNSTLDCCNIRKDLGIAKPGEPCL